MTGRFFSGIPHPHLLGGRAPSHYFHCHHGIASKRAAQRFIELGFREVYNLAGGIDAWSKDVDPSVKRY